MLHGFPSTSYDFAGAFWEGLKSEYKRIIVLDFLAMVSVTSHEQHLRSTLSWLRLIL